MNERLDIRQLRTNHGAANPNLKHLGEKQNSGLWNLLNKDIRLGFEGLSDKTKESFYLELWTLLSAGVDIRTALDLIGGDQKKKNLKGVFQDILSQVVSGQTLSGALRKNPQFTSYEYFSVQIGEETGKLLVVLKELALFFQKKIKQRQQVIGAVMYPAVVLIVAFAAVSFMLTYVVPMFSDVFRRFGNDLPAVTKIVIAVSALLKKFAGVFLLLVFSMVSLFFWQRKKTWLRKFSSGLLLKVPVIGAIVQKIYLSRFAGTMALLVSSKIPITRAIQLTRQMIQFYPIEESLYGVEQKITIGDSLHKSLNDYPIYPRKMVSMIKVGEEVNQLELFFARITEQYSNEVEYQANLLNKLLEPLIIVILGLVVGIVLIAMYLPLFKLGQGF
jgi:type IV pilus assembly protein PilC